MGRKTLNKEKIAHKMKQKAAAKKKAAKRFEILHRRFEASWVPKFYKFSMKQINLLMEEVALEIQNKIAETNKKIENLEQIQNKYDEIMRRQF